MEELIGMKTYNQSPRPIRPAEESGQSTKTIQTQTTQQRKVKTQRELFFVESVEKICE